MVSHLIEVLLQGVWSSMTGGWFFDPHMSIFINTVHMYAWIFLFVLPFSFYIIFPSNFLTWSIYSLIIFFLFATIKLFNYHLNRMFDKNKIIVNEKLVKMPKLKLKSRYRLRKTNHRTINWTPAYARAFRINTPPTSLTNVTNPNNNNNNNNSNNNNNNSNNLNVTGGSSRSSHSSRRNLTTSNLNNNNNNSTKTATKSDNLARSGSLSLSQQSRVDSLLNSLRQYDVISNPAEMADTANNDSLKVYLNSMALSSSTNGANKFKSYVDTASNNINNNNDESDNIHLAELLFSSPKSKSKKSNPNSAQRDLITRCNSSLSSRTCKSNGDVDEDDENYSNINFDETASNNAECKSSLDKKENKIDSVDDFNSYLTNSALNQNIENNSNRSLFKISEESLHCVGKNNGSSNTAKPDNSSEKCVIRKNSVKEKSSGKSSSLALSQKNSLKRKGSRNATTTTTTATTMSKSEPNKSNPSNVDDEPAQQQQQQRIEPVTTQSSICLSTSNAQIGSLNHYEEIKKTRKSNRIKSNALRRAQSEIQFEMFEKLIQKAQPLYGQVNDDDDDEPVKESRSNDDEYVYYEYDDQQPEPSKNNTDEQQQQSKATANIFTQYKNDSETLEKKLSVLKSYSSNKINNNGRSNEEEQGQTATSTNRLNISTSWKRLKGVKSVRNLLALSWRCSSYEKLNPFAPQSDNVSAKHNDAADYLSLSQQILYNDLRQFKATFECAKYLGVNNQTTRLVEPTTELNLECVKKRLLNSRHDAVERAEYEKQGAIPKVRKNRSFAGTEEVSIDEANKSDSISSAALVSFINEKEDRLAGHRMAMRRKSNPTGASRHRKTTPEGKSLSNLSNQQQNDYIEIVDYPNDEKLTKQRHLNQSTSGAYSSLSAERTIRFENDSQPTVDQPDTKTSSGRKTRSSRRRSSQRFAESKLTPIPSVNLSTAESTRPPTLSSSSKRSSSRRESASTSSEDEPNLNHSRPAVSAHKAAYDSVLVKPYMPRQSNKSNRKNSAEIIANLNDMLASRRRYEHENDDVDDNDDDDGEDESEPPSPDENEYDYINNDEFLSTSNEPSREPQLTGPLTGNLLKSNNRSSSSSTRPSRHNHHHSNHYRLNNSPLSLAVLGSNSRQSQQQQHHYDDVYFSNTSSRRNSTTNNHHYDDEIVPLANTTTSTTRSNYRSRTVDSNNNRNFDGYTSLSRRQLIRSRLRFASRLRHINLRSNDLTHAPNTSSSANNNTIEINAYHVINHIEQSAGGHRHDTSKDDDEDEEHVHNDDDGEDEDDAGEQEVEEKNVKMYKLRLTKAFSISIPFDHYSLLAMMDKNRNLVELTASILMAVCVSVCAALILHEQIYSDICLVVFCVIVASCHYSLLKSVQPDSSSPIHGFNSLTPLSRPIYFCLTCGFIFMLRVLTNTSSVNLHVEQSTMSETVLSFLDSFTFYGVGVKLGHLNAVLTACEIFLLFFPVVFTLGLFPQISTFVLCILEQVDMFLFGSTAMNNLVGAVLSVMRSCACVLALSGVLYSSTYTITSVSEFSQSVLFSVYCALLVVVSYSLSRQSSDLWSLVELVLDAIRFRRSKKQSTATQRLKANRRNVELNEHDTFVDADNNNEDNIEMRLLSPVSDSVVPNVGDSNAAESLAEQLQQSTDRQTSSVGASSPSPQVVNEHLSREYEKFNDYISVADSPISSPSNLSTQSSRSESSSIVSSSFKSNQLNRRFKSAGATTVTSASEIAANNSMIAAASINPKENESIHTNTKQPTKAASTTTAPQDATGSKSNAQPQSTDTHRSKSSSSAQQQQQENNEYAELDMQDPFEARNKFLIKIRLQSDVFVCFFIFIFVFALHVSTVFTVLNPLLTDILFIVAIACGALNHYVIPHLRTENPWYLFNQPLFKPKHWSVFEPNYLARLEVIEVIQLLLMFVEKNIVHVLLILNSMTVSSDRILGKYKPVDSSGGYLACTIITVFSLKLVRSSFCEPCKQYKVYLIAYLFHKFDGRSLLDETILFDLFFTSIFVSKLADFLHKIEFIYVYTAPWQLPWGSAFHAFAQPLSAPHTSLLLLQTFVSSVIGAPLMPLMGSALFLLSYVRPVKFWEKNYNTKRVDNSNTRLQTQFDTHTPDSENLNAIFYEHLASVLQQSLCGDLMLGRWGNVQHGDFYILSSDYLNCLVHIIEIGNGFVTFQLRGLEFKGTYCQQRELEAITEDNADNEGCCCCKLGHIKGMLSFNASFHLRWVAWSIVSKKYIVNAYRIVDNDLSLIVNFYSLRKTLIDFYIKSAIFYTIDSPRLRDWLTNPYIVKELEKFRPSYIDCDACFDFNLDSDYDTHLKGVSLAKFTNIYFKWINHCREQRLNKELNGATTNTNTTTIVNENRPKKTSSGNNRATSPNTKPTSAPKPPPKQNARSANAMDKHLEDASTDSLLVRFCFALSLVCRRALITACTGSINNPYKMDSFDLALSIHHNHHHHGRHHHRRHDHHRTSSFGGGGGAGTDVNSSQLINDLTAANLGGSVNSINGSGATGAAITGGCGSAGATGGGLPVSHMDADSLSSFQHGYYTLFKGDIRIQSAKDEWVFNDMEILKKITLPAVRMGLRLHQDHFQNDCNDEATLYENLAKFDTESVLCYERDPAWRRAVLNNKSNLLSLRHQFTEYSDQYKVVMLNKNFLSFRVIKINKECVRSFWAGQQHELIFLRNKNQERGSIQNAKQVLRNIINSSCDQPIGYPIYVSPLITSYSSTHEQVSRVVGPEFNFGRIYNFLRKCFIRIRENCTNDCSGSADNADSMYVPPPQNQNVNISFASRSDACVINMNQSGANVNSGVTGSSNNALNGSNNNNSSHVQNTNRSINVSLSNDHHSQTVNSINNLSENISETKSTRRKLNSSLRGSSQEAFSVSSKLKV